MDDIQHSVPQNPSSEPPPRFSAHRWAAVRERLVRSGITLGGGRSPLSLDGIRGRIAMFAV
jgi:hypothetical protein